MVAELWNAARSAGGIFQPPDLAGIPEPARRYLDHAIAPGTSVATAVRLRMHGEIRLGRWLPFTAEQTIDAARGFEWQATVRFGAVPMFRGFDRLLDGVGEMRWKLLGLIPVVTAKGPDVTRSAIGRFTAESIWLPSVLVRDVSWFAPDSEHLTATFRGSQNAHSVELTIDPSGRVESLGVYRWGNPGGGPFRLEKFGGVIEAERTFSGFTIPSRVRVGWYFGSPRFESEGEFFRATIHDAIFS